MGMVRVLRFKMRPQQLILDRKLIQQSKEFLRKIYSCEEIIGGRNFDFLDGTSMRRKSDSRMTLDGFLKLNWKERKVRLQVGSPCEGRIVYCAAVTNRWEGVTRFAWIDGPFTEKNFREVAYIYNSVYGIDLGEYS